MDITSIKKQLKADFVGMDDAIDHFMSRVETWMRSVDRQKHPYVLPMWGLTGSGKSDLVMKFLEYADLKDVSSVFNLSEGDGSATNVYHHKSDKIGPDSIKQTLIRKAELTSGVPQVIFFDEFQWARTVDEQSMDIERKDIAVIWQLLDKGVIPYTPRLESDTTGKIQITLDLLLHLRRVNIPFEGIRIDLRHWKQIKSYYEEFANYSSWIYRKYPKTPSANLFALKFFAQPLYDKLNEEFDDLQSLQRHIKSLRSLDELIALYAKGAIKGTLYREANLQKSLIIIAGNLDHAFSMAGNLNSDLSPSDFATAVNKLTFQDIRPHLSQYFRHEHIGRLGRNHLIMPALTNENYWEIAHQYIVEFVEDYNERQKDICIKLHESSISHYLETLVLNLVDPALGVRPFKQIALRDYIDRMLHELVDDYLKTHQSGDIAVLEWDDTLLLLVLSSIDASDRTTSKVRVDFDKPIMDEQERALVAVHEAGHVIVHFLTTGIVPKLMTVQGKHGSGCTYTDFPDRILNTWLLRARVAVLLAGRCAERVIFGRAMTNGCSKDWADATELVVDAVKK